MMRLLPLLLLPFSLAVFARQPQASIRFDNERTIGEVHPHLVGNFTGHIGRCIYGGIFDEEIPLSDDLGFRKDVLTATREMGVTMVRWPGGNFVSGYNWIDGIGPRDPRQPKRDHAWGAESNRFGTDGFLQYCERAKVEPYLCINAGLGTTDQAWGLGNEIDGPWQWGHKNAGDYAKFALEAAKAMRRADESIKLIASAGTARRPIS
jgi:alpha-L-arabinofuranosidase